MASIIETGIDYSRIDDIPYMRRYLTQINDDLRYMLTNIDPEDNFSEEGLASYKKTEEILGTFTSGIEELQIALDDAAQDLTTRITQTASSIDLLVSKGDVTNQINISSDKVRINATRLHVYSDNFYIDNSTLKVKGTVIANAGNIGGFTIATDANNRQYLQGASGSVIRSGNVSGSKGKFGSLTCANEGFTDNSHWSMYNCEIRSQGLFIAGGFLCLNFDIARYSESSDAYTAWFALTINQKLTADEIHVGRNWDDSGQVRCYSVYSYFDGEKPGDDENSDRRLKEDFEPIDGLMACEFLKEVQPIHYRLIDEDDLQLGVIAQDMNALQDKYGDFGFVEEMSDGYYAVSYNRFVSFMAAAMKQIQEEIDQWQ